MPRSGKAASMSELEDALLFDKTFLGVEAFEFSADSIAQARYYMRDMRELAARDPERLKHISTYTYWAREKIAVWPELCDIALYWTSIPSSSVSMERAFAVMRKMNPESRASMLNATTARELKMSVNCGVLTAVLEEKLSEYVL